jgi:hypothetical protein
MVEKKYLKFISVSLLIVVPITNLPPILPSPHSFVLEKVEGSAVVNTYFITRQPTFLASILILSYSRLDCTSVG